MCELLGISTATPAAISLSINRLAARGNVERHLAEIASVALTGEEWQPVPQGQILAVRGGAILDRSRAYTDSTWFMPQGSHILDAAHSSSPARYSTIP